MTSTTREAALEKQIADLRVALQLAREASKDLRRAGRAEAFAILLQHGAENIGDFIGSHPIADTGDYGEHWDEPKLRELLDVTGDDPTLSLIDRLEGIYWDHVAEIDALSERAPAPRCRHRKTGGILRAHRGSAASKLYPHHRHGHPGALPRPGRRALGASLRTEFHERFEPLAKDEQKS